MDSRAADLVRRLRLEPHPEGGHYREIFRSPVRVLPRDGRTERAALTAIYYLLEAGGRARWHRLRSDEVWTHLEGGPVRLLLLEGAPEPAPLEARVIAMGPGSPVSAHEVPAGVWQAAEAPEGPALVACVTGPGFEFEDWALLADDAGAAARLRASRPELARLL